MQPSATSVRAAALAALCSLFAGAAFAGEIHVLLGIDPADTAGDVLLSASLAPAQTLTKATGQRTTVAQTMTSVQSARASPCPGCSRRKTSAIAGSAV